VLDARLIGADQLYAVSAGHDAGPAPAREAIALVDSDTASWASWNRYAHEFAHDTGARLERIDDGGVTGPGFFDHVRRLRRPAVNSPKGQTTPLPPDLVQRPIVDPTPLWTWWLVSRSGETRAAVRASVEALTRHVRTSGLGDPGTWVPVADPYRPVATTA
jgi:hypothetical protein